MPETGILNAQVTSTGPKSVTLKDIRMARKGRALNHALALLDALSDEDVHNASPMVMRAQILRMMMSLTDAKAVLSKHVQSHSDDRQARQLLIETARVLGDFDDVNALLVDDSSSEMAIAKIKLALAQGDVAKALQLSQSAYATWPQDRGVLTVHCDVLAKNLRHKEAASLLDAVLQNEPEDHVFIVQRAQLAVSVNDLDTANALLQSSLPTLQALQIQLNLDALSGRPNSAAYVRINARMGQLLSVEDDGASSFQTHLDLGDLLYIKEDWRGALRQFKLADANAGQNRMRSMKVARCHYKLLDFTACRAALTRVLEQVPNSLDALSLRATIDTIEGRSAESIATLEHLFALQSARKMAFGVKLMRSYMRIEKLDQAHRVQAELVGLGKTQFEPELVEVLLQFGAANDAFEVCTPWAQNAFESGVHLDLFRTVETMTKCSFGCPEQNAHRLPVLQKGDPSDIQSMAAIGARLDQKASGLPVPLAVNAAWAVSDHTDMGFRMWQRLARMATANTRRVSHIAPRAQDIAEFTDFPDRSALGVHGQTTGPLIFMSSHGGPSVSCALDEGLLAGRELAYLRTHTVDDRQKDRLITVGYNPQNAAKALVQALAAGKTIGMAVDSPTLWQSGGRSGKGATGTVFDVPVTISTTPLKLAHAFGVPMIWVQPLWRDGRITFEIEEMDVPPKDMPFQDAANIWAADYLARVARVMCSGPENQDLSAPMWQHLAYNGLGQKRA